jgi:hypothetical protein
MQYRRRLPGVFLFLVGIYHHQSAASFKKLSPQSSARNELNMIEAPIFTAAV